MSFAQHYADHIKHLRALYGSALTETCNACSAILLHSGTDQYYYADDQTVSFRAYGHFTHWLPVNRPNQLVLIVPGDKPVYFQVVPRDFWHEQNITLEDWVAEPFTVYLLESSSEVADQLQCLGLQPSQLAYLGENTHYATAIGIPPAAHNPPALLDRLDYHRAYKTDYEVACIRKANRIALEGHMAARAMFENAGSEYDIHMAYLRACNILEEETPYTNIVALDEKSAILHYQYKRREVAPQSQVLLIDAGCRVNGYCSDITRTSTREHTLSLFSDLVEAMEELEVGLVQRVVPGISYLDIHIAAQQGVTEILLEHGICHGSFDELMQQKISTLFMPHGVGHLLGIQVHDVGGRQINTLGDIKAPPSEYPALRNTRKIEKGQVFTIEPGLYFIPQLLNPERNNSQQPERGKLINWDLVDALIPLGGIRIEDNVLVTASGVENLTRVSI
ncbi:MAG: Xaa-Pro dipeptidase [Gammaproteobacteria bacterium]|nr:Xaa-Pro dipeptidase [Gammaproteobacteria bacterium]MDP2141026.1 Xaa-Pro dipeptidase [Gammaproteobacteria bacterium]MDP2348485.1 Xaa-Pro dipeptidase [Gammaproteobacteria bacterium]